MNPLEYREKPRKVCVVLVDRANYGRLKPVMHAIQEHPKLKLQVIAAGAMVLERFGKPVEVLKRDGFRVDGQIHIELKVPRWRPWQNRWASA